MANKSIRSIIGKQVTINATPADGVVGWASEEYIPVGIEVDPASYDGVDSVNWNEANRALQFGPYIFNTAPRVFTYNIIGDTAGTYTITGVISEDGVNTNTTGDSEIIISEPAPITSAPIVDIGTGTYGEAQLVTVTPDVNAVSSYYTLDGTEPDNTKTLVDGTINISGNHGDVVTLKVVSYNSDGITGAVLTEVYTFDIPAPIPLTPSSDIGTGTYSEAQFITITDGIYGIESYYTLDGTEPNNTKVLVDGPIEISGNDGDIIILKVVSYNSDGIAGSVLTETYTFDIPEPAPLAPIIDIEEGVYSEGQFITVVPGDNTVAIYYTLDGTEPDNTKSLVDGPIEISGNDGDIIVLKLIAYNSEGVPGEVFTATYTFDIPAPIPEAPTVDIGTGTYSETQIVTVIPDTNAVHSYYTLDGTDPDNTKALVDGSITISGLNSEIITLKVVSYNSDNVAGAILTEVYTFDIPTPIPEIPVVDIGNGIYNGAQTVTVTSDINTISSYYTLDGTEPDNTKNLVDGSILVSGNHQDVVTLKVVNYNSDDIPGPVLTRTYSFEISESIDFKELVRLSSSPTVTTEWGVDSTRTIINSPNSYLFLSIGKPIYFKNTSGIEIARTIMSLVFGSTEIGLDKPLGENFESNDFEVYVELSSPTPSAPTLVSVINSESQSFVVNTDSEVAAFYYTLDSLDPDNTSTLVDGPIEISGADGDTVTLKVVGYNEDLVAGPISTNVFVFSIPSLPIPAAPSVNIGTGTYAVAQTVTVSYDENSEYSYYTLDGTDPDNTSTLVDGPITVSGKHGDTVTLKIVSYNGDHVSGPILTETYKFIKRTARRGTYGFA